MGSIIAGTVPTALSRSASVDVPRAIIVLGAAAVGVFVGLQVGGPAGAAVGALVGALVGGMATVLLRRVRVTLRPDGAVEVDAEYAW